MQIVGLASHLSQLAVAEAEDKAKPKTRLLVGVQVRSSRHAPAPRTSPRRRLWCQFQERRRLVITIGGGPNSVVVSNGNAELVDLCLNVVLNDHWEPAEEGIREEPYHTGYCVKTTPRRRGPHCNTNKPRPGVVKWAGQPF